MKKSLRKAKEIFELGAQTWLNAKKHWAFEEEGRTKYLQTLEKAVKNLGLFLNTWKRKLRSFERGHYMVCQNHLEEVSKRKLRSLKEDIKLSLKITWKK